MQIRGQLLTLDHKMSASLQADVSEIDDKVRRSWNVQ